MVFFTKRKDHRLNNMRLEILPEGFILRFAMKYESHLGHRFIDHVGLQFRKGL